MSYSISDRNCRDFSTGVRRPVQHLGTGKWAPTRSESPYGHVEAGLMRSVAGAGTITQPGSCRNNDGENDGK